MMLISSVLFSMFRMVENMPMTAPLSSCSGTLMTLTVRPYFDLSTTYSSRRFSFMQCAMRWVMGSPTFSWISTCSPGR